MFGKMKDLMAMKKQADQLKKELESVNVDVNEVPGVKIVIDGAQSFKTIEISPDLLKEENKNKTEAALVRSVNAAIKKSQSVAAQRMSSLMPGLQ